jgi:hypothetical protein
VYQGLGLAIDSAITQAYATGLLSSLATIQQRTNTVSATGQPNLSTWTNIAGLVNIACQFSIQRPAMPNPSATMREPQQFDTLTQYHVLLDGYYPQILQEHQAVVNGTAYEIMAVESDSQQTMTRLALREYSL